MFTLSPYIISIPHNYHHNYHITITMYVRIFIIVIIINIIIIITIIIYTIIAIVNNIIIIIIIVVVVIIIIIVVVVIVIICITSCMIYYTSQSLPPPSPPTPPLTNVPRCLSRTELGALIQRGFWTQDHASRDIDLDLVRKPVIQGEAMEEEDSDDCLSLLFGSTTRYRHNKLCYC